MATGYHPVLLALTLLLKKEADTAEPPFKVVAQMTGANSLIEAPYVAVVKDQPSWVAIWQRHRQSAALTPPGAPKIDTDSDRPAVDFEHNTVLCIFGGQSRNVGGFEIAAVGEVRNTVVVRVRPALLPYSGTGVIQNPFIMIVLPRTKKKMQVQLDQSAIGGAERQVLGDFPATKERSN